MKYRLRRYEGGALRRMLHLASSALMKGAVGDLARESWHNAHIVPIFHHLFYLSHFRWISKSFAHNRQELRVKIAHNRQELWTKIAHNRQELRAKIAHNRQELRAKFAHNRQERSLIRFHVLGSFYANLR
ncbi:MAG: hypothetical protein J6R92_07550 [Akkermansia sp.]|nr:hypothetical protein [Akkermansia sp.]